MTSQVRYPPLPTPEVVSKQIAQLRWEVAKAKSGQARLSFEIENFLSEEQSERTLSTYVGEDSSSSGMSSIEPSRRHSSTRESARNVQEHEETRRRPLEIVFENPEQADASEMKARKAENKLALYKLCEEGDWVGIRTWLDSKSKESIHRAILAQEQRSSSLMTTMHVLCSQKDPPLYLVFEFARIAPEACWVTDFAGRLPIHHAVISGVDPRVADILANAYPDSLMVEDRTGLLPVCKKHYSEKPPKKKTHQADPKH